MTSPTKRALERQADDLCADQEGDEWSDAEAWRAFLTGENPRTGEPISDDLEAEYRLAFEEFVARPDPEDQEAPS